MATACTRAPAGEGGPPCIQPIEKPGSVALTHQIRHEVAATEWTRERGKLALPMAAAAAAAAECALQLPPVAAAARGRRRSRLCVGPRRCFAQHPPAELGPARLAVAGAKRATKTRGRLLSARVSARAVGSGRCREHAPRRPGQGGCNSRRLKDDWRAPRLVLSRNARRLSCERSAGRLPLRSSLGHGLACTLARMWNA